MIISPKKNSQICKANMFLFVCLFCNKLSKAINLNFLFQSNVCNMMLYPNTDDGIVGHILGQLLCIVT